MGTLATYKPLYVWCSPASIPQIVAHIQDYLVKNPIVSTETVAEIVVQSLQEHPELINGSVIPITEDSAQSIKDYIDALPSLDGYTKAETDALLLLKQNLLTWDQTPTVGSSNPVTSEGIKAAISASAAALADLISTKADIASVYTKATTDALLLQKADAATTYSKNAVDALLDTKVDINNTYTKADIDLMKQVDKANTAIVTDGTAPFNITAGQYLYVNDILYMATEPITENDPLIPGTNIALTPKGVTNNIGDSLQSLARTVSTQSDQIVALGPYNGLDSDSTVAALSAAQGKALYQQIASLNTRTEVSISQDITLFRLGKLRLLHFEGGHTATDGVVGYLNAVDFPSSHVRGMVFINPTGSNGIIMVTTTGSIMAQYTTTYPGQLTNVPTTEYIYGELFWTVA